MSSQQDQGKTSTFDQHRCLSRILASHHTLLGCLNRSSIITHPTTCPLPGNLSGDEPQQDSFSACIHSGRGLPFFRSFFSATASFLGVGQTQQGVISPKSHFSKP